MIKPLLTLLLFVGALNTQAEEYLTTDDFLTLAFAAQASEAKAKTLWLKAEQKDTAQAIFGHPYHGLRVRYRVLNNTTAWIVDEIGKERPIRIGVIIDGDAIRQVAILAFEESRGWEVKYPFFTDQFENAALTDDTQLNKNIDGITGATLSVRAVTRVSRWALYLNSLVNQDLHQPSDQAPSSLSAHN